MRTLGNILWFFPLGLITGLSWYFAGIFCFISILGIPWGKACFVIGTFSFRPFGREIISRKELTGQGDLGTGFFGGVGNIIWFFVAGWWIAIGHLLATVFCTVTIIGIPFAVQHFKLAAVAICPIGKTVVLKHVAEAARMADAQQRVANIRSRS